MFGLGFWEIIFILTIALVVLGPEKLPSAASSLGKFLGSLRRSLDEIKSEITAPLSDFKDDLRSVNLNLDLESLPPEELTCEQRAILEERKALSHPADRASELKEKDETDSN